MKTKYTLGLPVPPTGIDIMNPGGLATGNMYNQGPQFGDPLQAQGTFNYGNLFNGGNKPGGLTADMTNAPLGKSAWGKGMDVLGGTLGLAGLAMNYQQMQKTNDYNEQNMALMQEQQGLARRAHDTNYANQQAMRAQMM